MNATPQNQNAITIRPPSLIHSLSQGFNSVANHIYLILLPVLLDLLLWFGPHLRVKRLLEPGVQDLMQLLRQASSTDLRPVLDNFETIWRSFLEQFNLFSLLSTFPVGIPTLMGGQLPLQTPLGAAPLTEIGSLGQLLLGWAALTLLGFLFGCLYFAGIAHSASRQMGLVDCESSLPGERAAIEQRAAMEQRAAVEQRAAGDQLPAGEKAPGEEPRAGGEPVRRLPPFRPSTLAWELLQVLVLAVLLVILALVMFLPALFLASLVGVFSPVLAQMVLLIVMLVVVWMLTPLVFSPHGIFLCGQSVLNAMLSSARVVRFMLPGTGIFLVMLILLSQGMNILWSSAPATSWMALIGIIGHAFIITGLLAASFIYYRSGLAYVQAIRRMVFKHV